MADEHDLSDALQLGIIDNSEKLHEVQTNLAAIQAGTLTNHHVIYSTIIQVGRWRMFETRPLIESFLTSDDPELRDAALMVLTLDFELPEHVGTALHFLTEDPDFSCRLRGASSAGYLMRGTNDRYTLATLAKTACNEQEKNTLRASAYEGILAVIGRSNREVFTAGRQYPKNVDWDLVASFLDEKAE